eukprot:jgi/Botrbrau1/11611/Bobra.0209s0002.1
MEGQLFEKRGRHLGEPGRGMPGSSSPWNCKTSQKAAFSGASAVLQLARVACVMGLWMRGCASETAFRGRVHARSTHMLCHPETWLLHAMNWTDGGSGVMEVPMCKTPQTFAFAKHRSRDTCSSSIASPKVAMLFLSKGELPHARTWEAWLGEAAGLLPADCVISAACGVDRRHSVDLYMHLLETCSVGDDVFSRQHLFSIYMHVPKDVPLSHLPKSADWASRVIEERIVTDWGGFSLVEAAQALFRQALKDPLNQRFILISESDLPLYPPDVVYTQLMYSGLSRINACLSRPDWGLDDYRWTDQITDDSGGRIQKSDWRKSHQWSGLIRKHARAAIDDREFAKVLSKNCYNGQDREDSSYWRSCYPDEHYFPTLLHLLGWEEETDCWGEMTHVVFCRFSCDESERAHPRTYTKKDFQEGFLQGLRAQSLTCDSDLAIETAAQLLKPVAAVSPRQQHHSPPPASKVRLLPRSCPLFARKFRNDTAEAALQAVLDLLEEDGAAIHAHRSHARDSRHRRRRFMTP